MTAHQSKKSIIKALIREGKKVLEIADAVDTDCDYVRQIRQELIKAGEIVSMRLTRSSVDQSLAVLALYQAGGQTYSTVAAAMGVSRASVAGIVGRARHAGLPVPAPMAHVNGVSKNPAKRKGKKRKAKRKDKPIGPPVVEMAPAIQTAHVGLMVTLEEVQESGGCRWVVNHDRPYLFCGVRREHSDVPFLADPSPFCEWHGRKATQKPTGSYKAAEHFTERMR